MGSDVAAAAPLADPGGGKTTGRSAAVPGDPDADSVAQLLAQVRGASGPGLAGIVTRRIEDGSLPPGTRLPTIGEIAAAAGLGRSTVAGVWSLLRDRGLVQTRRRGGTSVIGPIGATGAAGVSGPGGVSGPSRPTAPPGTTAPAPASASRSGEGSAAPFAGWAGLDLSSAHPSPDRLPDLLEAFAHSLREPETNALQREAITPPLRTAVAARWPFEAQDWVTVSGAGEATLLTAEAATPAGGLVAVAEPAVSGTVGNLRAVGFELVGVDSDADGPVPASLERALVAGARTVVLQPGGEFTRLGGITPGRLIELAEVVGRVAPDAWVLEEDVLGPLAPAGPVSLGHLLPGRVVRVTSFCRAYGLDLRTTVVGGAREVVAGVRRLRSHGILAQSRILQNALAYLLGEPAVARQVEAAAAAYAARGVALAAHLRHHDIEVAVPPGGLLVWVRAENEEEALSELATRGIVLAPSARTHVDPPSPAWLRVATPQLPADEHLLAELADTLATAASGAVLAG